MSVTSGFFNSLSGDRKYYAEQMSSLFDGIINDGVFSNIGTAFAVKANGGNNISVGVGRAWFNSTWIYNNSELVISAGNSSILQNRYDAVVIEVDRSDSVRAASIKIIEGTASSTPVYPTLINETNVHQHALAFIYRGADTNEITQSNIVNCVGGTYCPYITGILQVQDISKNVAQWEAQWNEWFANRTDTSDNEYEEWKTKFVNDAATWLKQFQDDNTAWEDNFEKKTTEWFESVKGALLEDPAVTLANRLIELEIRDSEKVKKSGDTMAGPLAFHKLEAHGTSTVDRDETVENYHGLFLIDTNESGKKVGLRLCSDLNIFQILANDVWHDLYSEYRKPTTSELNAVNKNGDTILGQLDIKNEEYIGLTKTRTVDGGLYTAALGVGNDSVRGASASFRLTDPSGNTIGRIDVWKNGTVTYSPNGSSFYDLYHSGDTKMAFGSYTGTGAIGQGSPCSLSFDFKPKLILIYRPSSTERYFDTGLLLPSKFNATYYTSLAGQQMDHGYSGASGADYYPYASGLYGKLSSDGKTVYWYYDRGSSSNASFQMNGKGDIHYYYAFGV